MGVDCSVVMIRQCVSGVFSYYCKQKTAYELRSSDWSSEVCSADLAFAHSGDLLIVGHDLPHMTILAILTANGFSGGDHRRPYRRGRAIRFIVTATWRELVCHYV